MKHNHLEKHRFKEEDLTPEEVEHLYECDYCTESCLLGEDLNDYETRKKMKLTTKS